MYNELYYFFEGSHMDEKLLDLQMKALKDENLRQQLLATKNEADPMKAFCDKCTELGYPLTVGELFAMGQDFCDSMVRSVNGGGVNAPDGWNDAYEMFFSVLEIKN